jgi:hypothetical protein
MLSLFIVSVSVESLSPVFMLLLSAGDTISTLRNYSEVPSHHYSYTRISYPHFSSDIT